MSFTLENNIFYKERWSLLEYSMSRASQQSMPPSMGGQVGDFTMSPSVSPTWVNLLLAIHNTLFHK